MTKTLGFGIIGVGRFGKNYIRNIKNLHGTKLIAIAGKSQNSFNKISSEIPDKVIKAKDASEILENKDVDCVVIATPPSTHFQIAKQAIEAGKHVLLEKPMVKNIHEAKQLKKIVGKSKKVFMVGHQYLYNDHINFLKSQIQNNHIGKMAFVASEYLYPEPMRYDIGCLWDAGTHILSILQYLFDPGRITKVQGKSFQLLDKGFDDFNIVAFEFENGLKASIVVSWIYPEKTRRVVLLGEKKTAIFDEILEKDKLRFYDRIPLDKINTSVYNHVKGYVPEIKYHSPSIKAGEPLHNELMHFIDCIRKNKEPLTNMEHSFQITEWLDKISREIKIPGY